MRVQFDLFGARSENLPVIADGRSREDSGNAGLTTDDRGDRCDQGCQSDVHASFSLKLVGQPILPEEFKESHLDISHNERQAEGGVLSVALACHSFDSL